MLLLSMTLAAPAAGPVETIRITRDVTEPVNTLVASLRYEADPNWASDRRAFFWMANFGIGEFGFVPASIFDAVLGPEPGSSVTADYWSFFLPPASHPASLPVWTEAATRIWLDTASGDLEGESPDSDCDVAAVGCWPARTAPKTGLIESLHDLMDWNVEEHDGPLDLPFAQPWVAVSEDGSFVLLATCLMLLAIIALLPKGRHG